MNRTFLILAATVSTIALAGCNTSSSSKSGGGGATLSYSNMPVESTGATGPNATDHENINDNRFEITFTDDQRLIITDVSDSANPVSYEFDEDDLQSEFNLHSTLHMYATAFDNGQEAVTLYTPEQDRENPEYALTRFTSGDQDHWAWMGTPTSTVLSGTATYEGGYYLVDSASANTANGDLTIAANFGGNGLFGTMDFTLHKPASDTNNDVFGVDSITFTSGVSAGNVRTADGGGNFGATTINEAGSIYSHATVAGGIFENGGTTAGLIHLEDTTNDTARYGGYHAQRQP